MGERGGGATAPTPPDSRPLSRFPLWPPQDPKPASAAEVASEAAAAARAAEAACAPQVVLERVAVTTTGVLLACWQAARGAQPERLRQALREALPRSPAAQLYDPVILHTTLARLLQPPPGGAAAMAALAAELSEELCGLTARIPELWYVQERDMLALGLRGRYEQQPLPMQGDCGGEAEAGEKGAAGRQAGG